MKEIEIFLNYLKYEKRFSDHTIINYKKDLTDFMGYQNKSVSDIKLNDIRSYLKLNNYITQDGILTDTYRNDVANNTLTKYEEDITEYYDFGYFLKENVEDNKETEEIETGFVTAGTKHPDNDKISWTKQ